MHVGLAQVSDTYPLVCEYLTPCRVHVATTDGTLAPHHITFQSYGIYTTVTGCNSLHHTAVLAHNKAAEYLQ